MAFINGHIISITEEIADDISTVLEFVERWNKQDKERKVAAAAGRLDIFLATYQGDEGDHINGQDDGEAPDRTE